MHLYEVVINKIFLFLLIEQRLYMFRFFYHFLECKIVFINHYERKESFLMVSLNVYYT